MIPRGKTALAVLCVFLLSFLTLSFLPLLTPHAAAVGELEPRKITLEAGTDPGSKPGGTVKYKFDFTTATTGNVGSIDFKFCTSASVSASCTAPTGLDIHSATLSSQSGATGFSLNTPTVSNSEMYITRTASSVNASTALSYEFSNVVNPTTTNFTFYTFITTYASTDTTGGATDTGAVAASTATQIVLSGYMPESLIFCTGGTISNTGGIPDCTTATSGTISFNQDFSPVDTATASNQMAASTNADFGYAITVNGATLTSGSNTVTAMTTTGTGDAGVRGTSQFGLNLRANTGTTSTPAVGADVSPASNGTNYNAEATTGYASVDHFRFVTGETVADSAFPSTGQPSDIQTYTVSYIVNVNGAQPVGTYTTTLTYICTPTF